MKRTATRVVAGVPTSDGAGVKLTRILGQPALKNLDPFLLLDEFRSDNPGDYIAGFPPHPHRGFETVTYMLAGKMEHKDSVGNTGNLEAGSVQWMTAGRGIVHSEMPQQEDGLIWGFQLWVNLPASDKMTAPRYQDVPPEQIPVVAIPGGSLRVVAGSFGDVTGPVGDVATEPLYLDLVLSEGAVDVPVPEGHTAFAYVFEGSGTIADVEVERGQFLVLEDGDEVSFSTEGGLRALFVAGRPIGEPIVQYGPFVMNSMQEIQDAIRDYQAGRFAG